MTLPVSQALTVTLFCQSFMFQIQHHGSTTLHKSLPPSFLASRHSFPARPLPYCGGGDAGQHIEAFNRNSQRDQSRPIFLNFDFCRSFPHIFIMAVKFNNQGSKVRPCYYFRCNSHVDACKKIHAGGVASSPFDQIPSNMEHDEHFSFNRTGLIVTYLY